jgi:protein-S-isoprenylcysteine O-methyltransferase Ste14
MLSICEWSLFSLYWSAAAKNSSRVIWSESSESRRFHKILVNIALLLVVLPVYEMNPRFLPGLGWISWTGLSIQTISIGLALWARRHLASHWSGEITIKVNHQLIRSGPYQFVRHPIYAAILGMFVGSAIVSGRFPAFVGVSIAALAYRRKIRLEEVNLRHAFGPAYDIYERQTGSLLPKRLV